jgi:hypothetical protein
MGDLVSASQQHNGRKINSCFMMTTNLTLLKLGLQKLGDVNAVIATFSRILIMRRRLLPSALKHASTIRDLLDLLPVLNQFQGLCYRALNGFETTFAKILSVVQDWPEALDCTSAMGDEQMVTKW